MQKRWTHPRSRLSPQSWMVCLLLLIRPGPTSRRQDVAFRSILPSIEFVAGNSCRGEGYLIAIIPTLSLLLCLSPFRRWSRSTLLPPTCCGSVRTSILMLFLKRLLPRAHLISAHYLDLSRQMYFF